MDYARMVYDVWLRRNLRNCTYGEWVKFKKKVKVSQSNVFVVSTM